MGDVIETGPNATAQAQLEFAGSAIVEVGPSTQVYVFSQSGTGREIILLTGWIKGETISGTYRYLSPRLSVETNGGNVLLHATEKSVDAFVERGSASVTFGSGMATTSSTDKLFFSNRVSQPKFSSGRPSADFVAEMPICFRDMLPSRLPRFVGKSVPKPERDHDVSYTEVERLLTLPPRWRKGLVVRFKSRLQDRGFRQAIEAHISTLPEWKSALDPEHQQSNAGPGR
jgi:hypothetical protein